MVHLVWLVALLVSGCRADFSYIPEPDRLGCYEDNSSRVWKQFDNSHQHNTIHFCKNMCQDFKYAGVQAAQWCMCGDHRPRTKLPDSKCNLPCNGNRTQTCGGSWAMEVFPVEPKPVLVGKPMGCFKDIAGHVWQTGLIKLQSNSQQRCFNSCRGFQYAGLMAGDKCMCGHTLPTTPLPTASCQSQCSGYPGKTCGGHNALDVFELSEPQDPVKAVDCVQLDYQRSVGLGHYKLYAQRKTWNEAWQQCEDDDAHLVIINSEKEANLVRSLFAQVPSESRMHAGFHDLLHKGYYVTLLGKPLSSTGYNVWSTKHPLVASSLPHCGCVDVRAHLEQVDGNCRAKAMFVCEKKPEDFGAGVEYD